MDMDATSQNSMGAFWFQISGWRCDSMKWKAWPALVQQRRSVIVGADGCS